MPARNDIAFPSVSSGTPPVHGSTPLVGAVVRPQKLPFDKLTVLDCNVSATPPEAGGGSRLRVCGSHQSPRRARFVTPSERG